jgi:hypothetical protein
VLCNLLIAASQKATIDEICREREQVLSNILANRKDFKLTTAQAKVAKEESIVLI